ncbi:hypothetical protein J2W22_000479 [Sphingomonas kyeonggiensis]|uniref:hypothetical protein n=1 Tax=Sphingomonas kyeonggiensis TaxID=1268553 RepID=UPI00278BA728|nr:hypothetical protein [Sphingomonas kyeonggiensis]MDQ0248432.1 hypothetical protein [Sphingomonas kyeonggiensis]
MGAKLLLTAIAGQFLVAMASGIPKAYAAPAPMCGVGIVETAMCMDWWMKRAEHDSLVAKARGGDRESAGTLALFHSMTGEDRTSHRWAVLAAERGHCLWIGALVSRAQDRGDRTALRKWNARWRWNRCKPAALAK